MQKFIEHKCKTCMSACKNSKCQSMSTKNINQAEMTVPVEETGINTSGYLLDGNITSEPYVFFGIDRSSEWLVFRLCIFTETMDVITFFGSFRNLYGVRVKIKPDRFGLWQFLQTKRQRKKT